MSGVRLGRPPKNLSKSIKKQAQSDESFCQGTAGFLAFFLSIS
ncbi:MAG: hypothetical protein EAZ94_32815 [Oscillatoriales cyanobacterium]|nr:MAG: hypothetical protein EAZ94_32815 [Oscillatoriales cyanobacterium]